MKLSISNIAWSNEQDEEVYDLMKQYGFSGLEIAPTRWYTENPYEHIQEAYEKYQELNRRYGFQIASMQSIWYGKNENIWTTVEERTRLVEYTKKAIDYAAALRCNNLVFGCPRNRNKPDGVDESEGIPFFHELGIYAEANNTVLALEANPPLYHTNYINTTGEACILIQKVDSTGFRLNLDIGAMIENGESFDQLAGNWKYVNHVHISEPSLMPIQKRLMHRKLADILRQHNYSGYVSIEMGRQNSIEQISAIMSYVAEVFG